MAVTNEQIIERLRALLAESDLQTTTEKMLRKKLEEEFKMDMLDRKPMIRREIEKYLAEQEDEEEDEEEEEEEAPKATARGSGLGCLLSEPLQKFLGVETLPRTQVVKRLWEYIKSNNLQDPKDKRKIVLDAKLGTIFSSPLTMFSMNTQLSKHCKTMDAASNEPRPRPSKGAGEKRSTNSGNKPTAKKAKAGDGAEGEKEKRSTGFSQPMRASAELANWCGKELLTRAEAVRFFWDYVKERNLQDPAAKKFVNCDAALKKLTGEDRIEGFTISKYISQHLTKA